MKSVLTEAVATQIYDILVSECEAPESARAEFIQRFLEGKTREWRFKGNLGFGGKFWHNHDRFYVNCYPEDYTKPRLAVCARTNDLLAAVLFKAQRD